MKKPGRIINYLFLIAGIIMIVYYLAMGFCINFTQSLLFMWPLVGAACIARYIICAELDRRGKRLPRGLTYPLRIIFCLVLALFLVVEGIIATGFSQTPPDNLNYIIVLGARVNGREPSGALRNRVGVARAYLEANPATVAVLSGGRGRDEEISEAQCMYEILTAAGIDPARLILEDQSTDTLENLRFSRAIITDENATIGIVSNNFHIFRALALARGQGMAQVYGIPVPTSALSLPHYMMREFASVAFETVHGNMKFE